MKCRTGTGDASYFGRVLLVLARACRQRRSDEVSETSEREERKRRASSNEPKSNGAGEPLVKLMLGLPTVKKLSQSFFKTLSRPCLVVQLPC